MDDLLMKSPEFIDRFLGKAASVHLVPDLFSDPLTEAEA